MRKNFSRSFLRVMVSVVHLIYLLLLILFCSSMSLLAKVSTLGQTPDWSELNRFQQVLSQDEFIHLLTTVYCPREEWWSPWIQIEKDRARVRESNGEDVWYDLYFKDSNKTNLSKPRFCGKPPHEWVVGIDPGHIGGEWAKMERREFSIGQDRPVREGELTLAVAKELLPRLQTLGVRPVLIREELLPVTSRRPVDFSTHAQAWADEILGPNSNATNEEKSALLQERQELLFYRIDEIQERARIVNQSIQPDLVICLHFNAAPWPDPEKQQLVERDDHHMLVNGCYMGGELAYDDQRFELIWRLVNRWSEPEQRLAECLSRAFSKATGLPTFSYKGPNALKIGDVPGVWARNLLANRRYYCPVVFLEPYVANSQSSYPRIQKWLEKGEGEDSSIITEYADAVMLGLESFIRESQERI
jgi:N-acetylmuramoyl-L-alanine amidase